MIKLARLGYFCSAVISINANPTYIVSIRCLRGLLSSNTYVLFLLSELHCFILKLWLSWLIWSLVILGSLHESGLSFNPERRSKLNSCVHGRLS